MTSSDRDETPDNLPPSSRVRRRMPRVLGGRFEVRAILAEGGMSIVYQGWDRSLRCPVVIKSLHPNLYADEDAVARFKREPGVLAQLAEVSDGFVRPLDAGSHNGHLYLVTERLTGETLQALLEAGPLSLADVTTMVEDVARALGAGHRLGVIHRDIKPENLFRVWRDGAQRFKVLDLGVAKQIDPRVHLVKTASLGTPLYMAPESLCQQPIGPGVDGWGLGAVAYHALTGRYPFPAETLIQVIQIVCYSDTRPPPPSTLVADLPPALDGWFERALARDPARRFPDMKALAETFRAASSNV